MVIHRSDDHESIGQLGVPVDPGKVLVKCPHVLEFLTSGVFGDDSLREVPTVLLFWEQGEWRMWLHDRAEKRSAWLAAATWEALLGELEALLARGAVSWRKDARKK